MSIAKTKGFYIIEQPKSNKTLTVHYNDGAAEYPTIYTILVYQKSK